MTQKKDLKESFLKKGGRNPPPQENVRPPPPPPPQKPLVYNNKVVLIFVGSADYSDEIEAMRSTLFFTGHRKMEGYSDHPLGVIIRKVPKPGLRKPFMQIYGEKGMPTESECVDEIIGKIDKRKVSTYIHWYVAENEYVKWKAEYENQAYDPAIIDDIIKKLKNVISEEKK